jgi:hypothetical protein
MPEAGLILSVRFFEYVRTAIFPVFLCFPWVIPGAGISSRE